MDDYSDLIVACPLDSPPVLAEISTGKKTVLPISKELEDDPEANLKFTATFSVDGCYVLTGDSKGSINVIELATNKVPISKNTWNPRPTSKQPKRLQ